MQDDNGNSLSGCTITLTEDEYDVLISCFTLGSGMLAIDNDIELKSIEVTNKYLHSLFGDRRESFDIAFNSLRDKFIKQNNVYKNELNL